MLIVIYLKTIITKIWDLFMQHPNDFNLIPGNKNGHFVDNSLSNKVKFKELIDVHISRCFLEI